MRAAVRPITILATAAITLALIATSAIANNDAPTAEQTTLNAIAAILPAPGSIALFAAAALTLLTRRPTKHDD